MAQWFDDNSGMLIWVTVGSALAALVSVIAVVVVIVRLPPDHFQKQNHTKGSLAWRVARNILGWLLIAAGLAMLVLPGQGVLVLFIGVMLAEFPGKRRLQRWIISRGKVQKTINWLRAKFGREPLEMPQRSHHTPHPA